MKRLFKIEKNIPIPVGYAESGGIYPFLEMEIGDSFFIETENHQQDTVRVHNTVTMLRKRKGITLKMKTAKVKGGIRVWRIV